MSRQFTIPSDVNGGMAVVQRALVSAAVAGDNTLVAAVSGMRIRLIGGIFVASGGTNTLLFRSGATSPDLSAAIGLAANGQLYLADSIWGHLLQDTASGELLNLRLTAATAVTGWIRYVLVPA